MPIEIRELIIRAVVEPPPETATENPTASEDRARLVQQCVGEVLKALRRRTER